MTLRVEYWLSVASPWTWLSSARFKDLLARHGAQVELLPMDLSEVFAATGGTPFHQRSPARQSYRQLELARWSSRLGIPINLTPRYYPVDRVPASCLLIAAGDAGLDTMTLSHAVLRAIWCEDRDIADWPTLAQLVEHVGHDGESLVKQAQRRETIRRLEENTQRAVQSGVFGAPTFIVDGERFWGQDRLDFLEERLKR